MSIIIFLLWNSPLTQFLRDELKYDDRKSSDKNKKFHGNDGQISVDELWTSWTSSKVHNWTVEEVMDWLSTSVQLPQYSKAFFINEINGSVLPRLVQFQVIFDTFRSFLILSGYFWYFRVIFGTFFCVRILKISVIIRGRIPWLRLLLTKMIGKQGVPLFCHEK